MNRIASAAWSEINHRLRRRARARSGSRAARFRGRVISVGNLQAGGSGKTPLVARIAERAAARGLRVGICLRGYRSEWERTGGMIRPAQSPAAGFGPRQTGDEAALLHALVPQAWIAIGRDRAASMREVESAAGHALDVWVLDDAFQNHQIAKDVEIVLLTDRAAGDTLFRDRPEALRYADWVIGTKGREHLDGEASAAKFIAVRLETRLETRLGHPDKSEGEREPGSARLSLITGIGDAPAWEQRLLAQRYSIASRRFLADHYAYRADELRSWLRESDAQGLQVATTGKDWVKWSAPGMLEPHELARVAVFEVEVQGLDREDFWESLWRA